VSLHSHVGVVAPGVSLNRRRVLVAAARSRGITTSVDDELDSVRRRLAEVDTSMPSLVDTRRRVAETETDLEEKRERVATLRGRLQAADDESTAAEYRAAVRELSEVETRHLAAREALRNVRKRARGVRDKREQRLRLQDRAENLRREARTELIESVRPAIGKAISSVPGSDAESFGTADPVTAALAAIRVGTVHVPVVLACRRFPDAASAVAWLDAPVCRL
jgi:hypothetical protein